MPIGERRKLRKVCRYKASCETSHIELIFEPEGIEFAGFTKKASRQSAWAL